MATSVMFPRMRLLVFIAWPFLFSIPAHCQYELRSATIVTQNDTLLGQVKYYDWDVSPAIIDFIRANGSQQSLPVSEIKRMVIAPDNIYVGRQLSFSTYPREVPNISAALTGRPASAYLLLELLLESDVVRFYRFFDSETQKRFFLEKGGITHPLDYVQTTVVTDNRRSAYDNPLFRAKLKQILEECPTIQTDELPYTETAIMALLREYHSYCRVDAHVYQEQRKIGKIKVSLGLIASSFPFADKAGDPFRYGLASQIGVSVRFLMPQRFNNYFILADIAKITVPNALMSDPKVNLAIYGGRYFGRGALQGQWYTGISIGAGPLETGVGLSYKKIVSVSASFPVLSQLIVGFNPVSPPIFTFRLFAPFAK